MAILSPADSHRTVDYIHTGLRDSATHCSRLFWLRTSVISLWRVPSKMIIKGPERHFPPTSYNSPYISEASLSQVCYTGNGDPDLLNGNVQKQRTVSFESCTVLSYVMKSFIICLCPTQDVSHPFVHFPSISHLVDISVIRLTDTREITAFVFKLFCFTQA